MSDKSSYFKESSLDELMRACYAEILENGLEIEPSKGKCKEILGATLELENPRMRISRSEDRGKLFSAVGELAWYLSGTNKLDFVSYYIPKYGDSSDDNLTLRGAYGPRIFKVREGSNKSQYENIRDLLRLKPDSRQAIIQLFDQSDIDSPSLDVPCTCTLQFLLRDQKLHLIVNMRSSDAYWGLPHDVFFFTMLQEILASELLVDVGTYKHVAGSLHVYEDYYQNLEEIVTSPYESPAEMEQMPTGDNTEFIKEFLRQERAIRTGEPLKGESALPYFWKDLVFVLKGFSMIRQRDSSGFQSLIGKFHSDVYALYFQDRLLRENFR